MTWLIYAHIQTFLFIILTWLIHTIAVRPVTLSSDPRLEIRWLRRRWRECRHRLLTPPGPGTTPKCSPGGHSKGRSPRRCPRGATRRDLHCRTHRGANPHEDWQRGPYPVRPSAEYDSGDSYGSGVGRAAPFERGGASLPPVAPVHRAQDNLMEALRGASVVDEHHVVMGAVIEKVQ